MSAETIEWLNQNTMIGYTKNREAYADRGWAVRWDEETQQNVAWWHTPEFQNGYDEAIPVEEIERVLFNWEPVETEVMHKRRLDQDGNPLTEDMADAVDGMGPFLWVPSERFKGIIHPETEYEFGVFGIDSYKVHSYKRWLLDNLANLVDVSTDEAGFATAGLLRSGGVAYVTIEMPENVEVAGMDIRPMLLAATSLDGTKATTYKAITGVPVCDNTLDMALEGDENQLKIRHSSRSIGRLQDARDAIGIIYKQTEVMEQFLNSLADVDVTDAQFNQIVQQIKPIPEPETKIEGGKTTITNQRAITIAENVQQDLRKMWHSDERCRDWNGTLLGALQTANTWNLHERPNSDNGVERVMTAAISGTGGKFDREFFKIVGQIEDIKVPDSLAALVS